MEDSFILFSIEATRFRAMQPPLTDHQESRVPPEDALWTQMDPVLISGGHSPAVSPWAWTSLFGASVSPSGKGARAHLRGLL